MQRDDHLQLSQIHKDKEALLNSIDEIARLALVKATDNKPLQLRFLTPLQPDGQSTDNNYVHLRLTSSKYHKPGLIYTIVSHCWEHEQIESEAMHQSG
jgi:hypothetical protein